MEFLIDCASWQGYPDWAQLKAEGHAGMISKVTGENNYVNPYASLNLERAHAAGLVTGGYDWIEPQRQAFLPTGEEAANDYARVLDAIGAWRKGFLPTVDWETPDWHTGPLGRNVAEYMRRYFARLHDIAVARGCANIWIYTAPYFLEETGGYSWDFLKRYLYWIAAPGNGMLPDDALWPGGTLVRPWAEATLHQHQWHARSTAVMGGGTDFDRNRFRGTRAQLWALGYQGGGQPAPEEGEVREPPADKVSSYVNERGETIVVVNFGGEAKGVLGTNYADLGVSVVNAGGTVYDRTIRDGEFLPWRQRQV